jgi:thiamine biosynthesis lipoprotein
VQFSSPGACLGFGGIAKGYVLDRMAQALRSREVPHALVSAGGSSVLALGGRDKGWTVDVRPAVPGQRMRILLRDGAVGTSGVGEQFALIDGLRDGRVMDPRTGHPVRNMRSATVVAAEAADADALSTAFLAGGAALARSYCDAHPNTLAVLTTNDDSATTAVFGAFDGATLLQ